MQNYASLQETHDTPDDHGIFLIHHPEPTRSRWNHVEDLDSFFSKIYKYHQSHGFRCMMLQNIFDLHQFFFIICLTVWLVYGVNYDIMFNPPPGHKTSFYDILSGIDETFRKFSRLAWFCLAIAIIFFILKVTYIIYQLLQFWDIKQFYNTALGIEDSELENLNWHEIQIKIRAVQLDQQICIHKRELTELDIYHRILRQENYMVALVNKGLLPPRIHIPFVGEYVYWTKALRFNIQLLLFWSPWSPFENPWHLREEYKRQNLRHELANQLAKHILWLALINLILAPAILIWEVLYSFFYYAEIIKREPGRIGVRNWSLYGKLYLRHFNELDNELHARLTRAYRPASKYLSAFSSPIVSIIAQHIAFLCGAIFAVIIVLTLYDSDVIAVEHVITLMTGLGGAIAVCRSIIPEESMVWCPESLLQAVVVHTHYMIPDWKTHAHTSRVREGFQQLFQYRFVALLEQLISPIMTPFLLLWWFYPRSLEIVDFFRHFTVSVVGVGDVCSFAQMDVKKHGNPNWQKSALESMDQVTTADQYSQAENGKVELSLVHFTTTNPNWVPPPEAKMFVDNILDDVPDYSDSDIFYGSIQADQPSVADYEATRHSIPNLRETRATLQSFAASSFPRNSVWKAEGPNIFGPLAMRQSCIALHDRNFRQTERAARSLEETTPLLPTDRKSVV